MNTTEPITALSRLVHDYSLEMTGKDVAALHDALHLIPDGTRVNVTFLANEDAELRVAAARAVRECGLVPVPHISARRLRSTSELEDFLSALREVDASTHVFAVGGDPAEPMGPYADALSIIDSGLLPSFGVTEVSIAGYPEGHPDIETARLWHHLEQKTRALAEQQLASVVLTQFGFDSERVVDWITEVRRRSITSQVRVGTPGPASVKRLLAFAGRFGIAANASIVKKYGFSLTQLVGTAGPDRFVRALAERLATTPNVGEVALHLYAFGGLEATARWAHEHESGEP